MWIKKQSFFEFPPSDVNCDKALNILKKMPNLKKVDVRNMWNVPSFPYFVDIPILKERKKGRERERERCIYYNLLLLFGDGFLGRVKDDLAVAIVDPQQFDAVNIYRAIKSHRGIKTKVP